MLAHPPAPPTLLLPDGFQAARRWEGGGRAALAAATASCVTLTCRRGGTLVPADSSPQRQVLLHCGLFLRSSKSRPYARCPRPCERAWGLPR